jgi:hypothetical protein
MCAGRRDNVGLNFSHGRGAGYKDLEEVPGELLSRMTRLCYRGVNGQGGQTHGSRGVLAAAYIVHEANASLVTLYVSHYQIRTTTPCYPSHAPHRSMTMRTTRTDGQPLADQVPHRGQEFCPA